jgi:hypothetical protein
MKKLITKIIFSSAGHMLHYLQRPALSASKAPPRRPLSVITAAMRPPLSHVFRPEVTSSSASADTAAAAAAPGAATASTSGSGAPMGRAPRRLFRTLCASVGAGGRAAGAAVKAPPASRQAAAAKQAPDDGGPWLIVGLGE